MQKFNKKDMFSSFNKIKRLRDKLRKAAPNSSGFVEQDGIFVLIPSGYDNTMRAILDFRLYGPCHYNINPENDLLNAINILLDTIYKYIEKEELLDRNIFERYHSHDYKRSKSEYERRQKSLMFTSTREYRDKRIFILNWWLTENTKNKEETEIKLRDLLDNLDNNQINVVIDFIELQINETNKKIQELEVKIQVDHTILTKNEISKLKRKVDLLKYYINYLKERKTSKVYQKVKDLFI